MDYSTLTANNSYKTPKRDIALIKRLLPSLFGYYAIGSNILRCSNSIKNMPDEVALPRILTAIVDIMEGLEGIGVEFTINNLQYTQGDTPVVVIANHMSSLETILTTGILGSKYPVSSVAKRSIISYPIFKHIFDKLQPILLDRVNPRDDFKIVMKEGKKILEQGRNIIIFPQGKRKYFCNPEDFSSIGVKLAKLTSVPVVPLALKTDAWGIGSLLRDIGRIQAKPVHFEFFSPISISSATGKEEHNMCVNAICSRVNMWLEEDKNTKK